MLQSKLEAYHHPDYHKLVLSFLSPDNKGGQIPVWCRSNNMDLNVTYRNVIKRYVYRELPAFETLPTCQIWQKKTAPLVCTASTMGFHASVCSFVHIPGVLGYLTSNKIGFLVTRDYQNRSSLVFTKIHRRDARQAYHGADNLNF